MKETLFCMTKDIRAVLIYYPVAVMTGFIGMLVYAMICKKICHRIEKGRMVAAFLFFTYICYNAFKHYLFFQRTGKQEQTGSAAFFDLGCMAAVKGIFCGKYSAVSAIWLLPANCVATGGECAGTCPVSLHDQYRN